jgi:hypothetical protein
MEEIFRFGNCVPKNRNPGRHLFGMQGVGIFPNGGSIISLIGAMLLAANDEWQTQNRYMQTEAMAEFTPVLFEAKSESHR